MDITEALDTLDGLADDAAWKRCPAESGGDPDLARHVARTEAREAVATIVAFLLPDGVTLPAPALDAPHQR